MARPIKATPRLSGKASYDFQKSLKENEKKKATFLSPEPDAALKEKIRNEGPDW